MLNQYTNQLYFYTMPATNQLYFYTMPATNQLYFYTMPATNRKLAFKRYSLQQHQK